MEAVTAQPGRLRVFEALRHRDFRLLWSGQAVSLLGDMAFLTALGWKAFTLAGSSRLGIVLLGLAAGELATLLVGGALADRYERRRMMIVSDVSRFVVVGALAAVDASGHLTFPILVVLAILVGLGDGFFYPAVGGIVPLVVEQPALPSANSLMGVARWGSVMVGPSLAAFVYRGGGASVVFAFDALTFLVSAALIYRARPRPIQGSSGEGTLREIREAARYVARIPWLWVTISLFAVVITLQYAPQQVLLPKLVHEHFDRGVGAYGLLTTSLGVGTVLGTLAFGQLQPRRKRGVIAYVVWLVNSFAIAGLALSPWFGLASALAVVRGACLAFGIAIWETMLQELVPEHLLSRVISLDFFGSFGLMPIGLAIWAGIAGLAAPGTMIATGAFISCALVGLTLTRRWLWEVD
jgi:MFS family permease